MIIKEDLIKSRYMIELDKYIDEVYSKDLNPNRRVFKDGKSRCISYCINNTREN